MDVGHWKIGRKILDLCG
jgi:hypothetical protein